MLQLRKLHEKREKWPFLRFFFGGGYFCAEISATHKNILSPKSLYKFHQFFFFEKKSFFISLSAPPWGGGAFPPKGGEEEFSRKNTRVFFNLDGCGDCAEAMVNEENCTRFLSGEMEEEEYPQQCQEVEMECLISIKEECRIETTEEIGEF